MTEKFFRIFFLLFTVFTVSAGEKYNFYMISDTHFGTAESFSEKVTGSQRTRADKMMPLYRKLFAEMAKRADGETAFIIHAGDLITGYAKDDLTQQKEFEKSIALLKEFFKFPIYYVRGNHEGAGGLNGYRKGLLPEISRTAGKELQVANYVVKRGEDVFIFADCYSKEWISFIDKTLKELKTSPRYLFVVIHSDVLVPFRDEAGKRIFQMLANYNSLILHGHTHCTVKLSQRVYGKTLTAFSVGTHISGKRAYPAEALTDFSKQLARICRQSGFERYPSKKAYFEKESLPHIAGFQDFSKNGFAQGYVGIYVSDDGVYAMIQGTDLKQMPIKVELLSAGKKADK